MKKQGCWLKWEGVLTVSLVSSKQTFIKDPERDRGQSGCSMKEETPSADKTFINYPKVRIIVLYQPKINMHTQHT